MKISLITATLGRVEEINDLLNSLVLQTYKNFEIIIVDQNCHTMVEKVVEKYKNDLNIIYIRNQTRGLSLNRNIGLKECSGDIIAFPDDDCYYDKNVLESINNLFIKNENVKFCACSAHDNVSKERFIVKQHNTIKRWQILKYCISYNVFVRNNKAAKFDENLGVGTYFSSGEETDYLFSIIDKGDYGLFVKDSKVFHPANNINDISGERAYCYGLGFGALFKKDILLRRNYLYTLLFLYYILRSLVGVLCKFQKKEIYQKTLHGRIRGFIEFKLNSI